MKNQKNRLLNVFKPSSPLETDRHINFAFGLLILSLMLTVLLAGGFYVTKVMNKEEDQLSRIITAILAKSISKVSFSGKYHARLMVEEIKNDLPDIKYLLVTNRKGLILAHSNPEKNNQMVDKLSQTIINSVLKEKNSYTRHLTKNNEAIREVSLAYRGGYQNTIIGVIQVGLSTQSRNKALLQGILYLILLVSILLIVGTIVTYYISSLVIKPIKQLANDMSATLQAIPDLLFELDINGKYLQIMTSKADLLAETREKLLNKTVFDVLPPKAAKTILNALHEADVKEESYGHEFMLLINQKERWFELSIAKKQPINQKQSDQTETSRFIVLSRDISQRKQDEQEIFHLAHTDKLTGLANRFSLEIRLEQAFFSAQRDKVKLAVMFIDMDQFKDINDTLGHHIGDSFLKKIALRLQNCIRSSDIIGRLGGDEFIVVLTDIKSNFETNSIAEKILTMLSLPYQIEENQIHSSCSIGISFFPDDGNNVEQLMKCADTAMYHAKSEGRNNFQFFSSLMTKENENRIKLVADIRYAIEQEQFQLYYQPQICTSSQTVCGVEALIRWNHPEKGLISPVYFIPVAEESGLIMPIGNWVIEEAFRQKSLWETQGLTNVKMSLNLSAHQLHSSGLVTFIKDLLEKYKLNGSHIEMEITESVAMDNPQKAIKILNAIRALDISLAIDDFGTGYSSLAYLKRLPIQTLKIDREFIRDIETDSNDAAISSATIALAHSLGLKVVAEGVETAHQKQFLIEKGCDVLQGYYYGKPMPNEDFVHFFKKSSLNLEESGGNSPEFILN
ncbi:MAG: EAL domain-containing protein [Pseudomonadota bacterium]